MGNEIRLSVSWNNHLNYFVHSRLQQWNNYMIRRESWLRRLTPRERIRKERNESSLGKVIHQVLSKKIAFAARSLPPLISCK